ncbi:10028_t:CDS:2, partial [Diversispora eburnea]
MRHLITMTPCHSIVAKSNGLSPSEIKIPYNQKVEQGLISELLEFIRSNNTMILQNSWYCYSEECEKKVSTLNSENNISDQMARTQIYDEMVQYLPGIKREYLQLDAKVSLLESQKIDSANSEYMMSNFTGDQDSFDKNVIFSDDDEHDENIIPVARRTHNPPDVLLGPSRTSTGTYPSPARRTIGFAHQAYKRGLQLILESNPPEIIALTIMKQLTQKINESNEVKSFWKLVMNILNIHGKRFNEKVDDLTQQVIKRMNLDNFDVNLSEDELPSMLTPAPRVNNVQGVSLREIMQAEFWIQKSDYDQNVDLTTPYKPILMQNQFNLLTPKVIPGFKFLKSFTHVRYLDIVKEIETQEKNQKKLISLGPTLAKWLRE